MPPQIIEKVTAILKKEASIKLFLQNAMWQFYDQSRSEDTMSACIDSACSLVYCQTMVIESTNIASKIFALILAAKERHEKVLKSLHSLT